MNRIIYLVINMMLTLGWGVIWFLTGDGETAVITNLFLASTMNIAAGLGEQR